LLPAAVEREEGIGHPALHDILQLLLSECRALSYPRRAHPARTFGLPEVGGGVGVMELWLSQSFELARGLVKPSIVNCLAARSRECQIADVNALDMPYLPVLG
jgi:hypothetical protein